MKHAVRVLRYACQADVTLLNSEKYQVRSLSGCRVVLV